MILSYYIGSKYLSSFFWSFLSIFFLILLVDGSDQVVSMSSQGHSFIVGLKNALIRIENNSYGICRVTGKLISKERLNLVPHATLSIEAKKAQ